MPSTPQSEKAVRELAGRSNEPIEEIWRSPLLQAIGTLRSTAQVWCADECAKLHDMMHKWAPNLRNETEIWKALLEKFRLANRRINDGEAQLARAERQMAAFGIYPCPNKCFEQEPGNGSFEVTSGWSVEKCPVCDGLGVLHEYAFSQIDQPTPGDTSC